MPVEIVKSSIFDLNAHVIVNPINTNAVSGCGLALEFKKRYPKNQELIEIAAKESHLKLGKIFVVWISVFQELDNNLDCILNIPTKLHPSRRERTTITTIDTSIESIKEFLTLWVPEYLDYKIAVPLLGAGAGALNPKEVKDILVNGFKDIEQTVLICDL
jgi:O-acetyl-ADP-ribose deacetylase (regulator of RNase III)